MLDCTGRVPRVIRPGAICGEHAARERSQPDRRCVTRMKILFVCTGNTCRSPLAEAIARKIAIERGLHGRRGDQRRHERAGRRAGERRRAARRHGAEHGSRAAPRADADARPRARRRSHSRDGTASPRAHRSARRRAEERSCSRTTRRAARRRARSAIRSAASSTSIARPPTSSRKRFAASLDRITAERGTGAA